MIWMSKKDYEALKAKADRVVSKPDAENAVIEFARSVINTFGLGEAYKVDFDYRWRDHGAERFVRDVRDASKHAAARDAVKRIRAAVRGKFDA